MRIALLSLSYPPHSHEGIPRQRQALAQALVGLGHEVQVICCHESRSRSYTNNGLLVHEVAIPPLTSYDAPNPVLNTILTSSQRLLQGVLEHGPFDIIDVPLWSAQGFATLMRTPGPSVVWLQTTTKQLLDLHGEQSHGISQQIIELERSCLEHAHGWLSDSQSALDSVQRDYLHSASALTGVVHIGIPDLPIKASMDKPDGVHLLAVGRLEQRKGTPFLFEILPALLRSYPQLQITFAGRDNSDHDGWKRRYGKSYPESFQQRFPDLCERTHFEGFVDEDRLAILYQQADIVLVPSLYESFGIVYLEAMRAAAPVITFAAGGASEIFPAAEQDGAVLVAPGDKQGFATALLQLIKDRNLRQRIGAAGRRHFQEAFTAERMARATLAFYERVIDHHKQQERSRPVAMQVVSALYTGDAVSHIVCTNANVLHDLGQESTILTNDAPEPLGSSIEPLEHAFTYSSPGLIFHYSGFNTAAWLLQSVRGPKALYYHNITPPEFFPRSSAMYRHLHQGYAQLRLIVKYFDLLTGDSFYNLTSLKPWLVRPIPCLHIYPIVEREELQKEAYDQELVAHLKTSPGKKLLFVGRLAPNKRPDKLMRLLEFYRQEVDPQAQLWLVGNNRFDADYQAQLEQLRTSLRSAAHIHIIGKVSDAELYAYYRAADVFVCASEHEGFCVPIAQAMAFDLPVLAYAATAVPETMGGAGILIEAWEEISIVQHLLALEQSAPQIIDAQHAVLGRFSYAEALLRLRAITQYLLYQEPSELFGYLS